MRIRLESWAFIDVSAQSGSGLNLEIRLKIWPCMELVSKANWPKSTLLKFHGERRLYLWIVRMQLSLFNVHCTLYSVQSLNERSITKCKTTCLSLAWKITALHSAIINRALNTFRWCRNTKFYKPGAKLKLCSRLNLGRSTSKSGTFWCYFAGSDPLNLFWSVNSARNVEGWSSAISSQLIAGGSMWVEI